MKKLILSAVVLAMVFVGCKKEETKPADSSSSSSTSTSFTRILKVTNYDYDGSGEITDSTETTYSYDANRRLISETSKSSDNYTFSSTFVYNSASLITSSETHKSIDTSYTNKKLYMLDANGQITKSYTSGKNDTINFYYSPSGFLKYKNKDEIVEVVDGNLVKQGNTTYEYYLDKINTIGNSNYGINFTGKESKNLVKTEKQTEIGQNGNTFTYEYSYVYEFDSKNRVIKSTRNTVSNGASTYSSKSVTKYQYIN
jgi:hypothetical protein